MYELSGECESTSGKWIVFCWTIRKFNIETVSVSERAHCAFLSHPAILSRILIVLIKLNGPHRYGQIECACTMVSTNYIVGNLGECSQLTSSFVQFTNSLDLGFFSLIYLLKRWANVVRRWESVCFSF